MTHYELLYIIPTKYAEEELSSINERIFKLIEENEGKITLNESLGSIKLAYPIRHVYQGSYMLIEFNIEPSVIEEMDAKLKLMPEVLRHLIVKKRVKTLKEMQAEKKAGERKEKKSVPAAKISPEELEQKLDKILEEKVI